MSYHRRHVSHQHQVVATLQARVSPLPSCQKERNLWLKGQMPGKRRLQIQPNNRSEMNNMFPIPPSAAKVLEFKRENMKFYA